MQYMMSNIMLSTMQPIYVLFPFHSVRGSADCASKHYLCYHP